MQAIENKILNRIYGHGRGWAFFKNDFLDFGTADSVDKALSRLTKNQSIRRVFRGVYDYPKYSQLLNTESSPDIEQVANALARKFGWNIQVSGSAALNILGLSTQVPTQFTYLSDGVSKTYKVGQQELRFKKTQLKDIGLKHSESALLVQALKTLNKRSLSEGEIQKIFDYFPVSMHKKILKDTQYTTSWVHELIKLILKKEDGNNKET